MDQYLTPFEQKQADTILHDKFTKDPDPTLQENLTWGAVGKSGRYVLIDRRTGRPAYGHC